jgi:hypothetical protein
MEPQVVDQLHIPAPPDQVRVNVADVSPYRDGRRVKVAFDLPPFRAPPDIGLVVSTPGGEEGVRTSVIGSVDKELLLAFTMRERAPPGSYAAHVFLQFRGEGLLNQDSIHFAVQQAPTAEGE